MFNQIFYTIIPIQGKRFSSMFIIIIIILMM